MKGLSSSAPLLALVLLGSCASTREQDRVDSDAIGDLVARIEATDQEQVGQMLRSVAAQLGEERTIRMIRRMLLEAGRPPTVPDKVLGSIGVLGLGVLPLVRDAVRVTALRPASVWALQRYCVGVLPQALDHPLTDEDIVYLGSLLGDSNPDTAKAAAVTLKSAGNRQVLALPALVEALRNQSARAGSASSGLCSSLLICLGSAGSAAESAVPIVLRKLDDEPDASMRSLILWTSCNVMPDCKKALSTLIGTFAPPEERDDLLKLLETRK